MAEPSEWELKRGQYLGEISALCFVHIPSQLSSLPYLLSGTGSQILIYDLVTAKVIRSFQVFEGIRVHGISCTLINCIEGSCSSKLEFKIAVFGERRVKLFSLHIEFTTDLQSQPQVCVDLIIFQSLPKFSHWVLDVCFLKDGISSSSEGRHCLAIGCSDNSVCFWDIMRSYSSFEVKSPERCLLYSMRMWGKKVETLHIASGTIFNENTHIRKIFDHSDGHAFKFRPGNSSGQNTILLCILKVDIISKESQMVLLQRIIVWKVVCQNPASCVNSPVKDPVSLTSSFNVGLQLHFQQYRAIPVHRLAGHEGSIFAIAWSSDGSKLVSVSDDRSARIWAVHAEEEGIDIHHSVGPVLFGHSARVWDCCIFDSLIITVGEDCTCRVWGLDGTQLMMIKEHIGRGVWRCLYDPTSSLLVTAGFDSAVKVHHLHASKSNNSESSIEVVGEFIDRKEIFTLRIPNSSGHSGSMDSKSEYVRCLHFTREDTIYIATNNGFLYHAKIFDSGDVKWTQLLQVSEDAPIICMNLLSKDTSDLSSGIEDWVAVGDGKGNMTIVGVDGGVCTPKVGISFTWSAELERQLLGTFWCKSLGCRFIFTADPRGNLKLWRLHEPLQSVSYYSMRSGDVSLVAEFISCFNIRIMCLDASFEEERLVCGDLRGNLLLFPLVRELLLGTSITSDSKISPSSYFKGAHGISSVCRVLIASSNSSHVEICSTGGDGCICYLEYDRGQEKLEFIGMKQVKELSLVQSVFYDPKVHDDLASGNYAIGFASADFIIWNLITERKVVQIPCGGWRRPNSYFLGDTPEMKNCFAFVKDEIIYIHRHWVPNSERKIYPQNLHLQFHGREMHSLCFISENSRFGNQSLFPNSCWIATGCEDGTVRMTRYAPGVENWTASKLLGEHVGGSAVRSICCVSKTHIFATDSTNMPNGMPLEDGENPFLLISVGAKRVLTAWKQKFRMKNKMEEALSNGPDNGIRNEFHSSSGVHSTMSFQWLSNDMPTKSCSTHEKRNNTENLDSLAWLGDRYENDWRYLAVTAFLVKVPKSRISVCFIVVACSDVSVVLRALILPYRLWFDIGLLVPLASPVLALQHVIIPERLAFDDNCRIGSQYIVLSGSTDGSIAFWDLTKNVETFMGRLSALQMEDYVDCQKRPLTGRGSQGGRWWRLLGSRVLKKKKPGCSVAGVPIEKTDDNTQSNVIFEPSSILTHSERNEITSSQGVDPASLESEVSTEDSSLETCKIWPLHTFNNVHQSGVNCLHVSDVKHNRGSGSGFLFYVISGGDDQALHCLRFDLALLLSVQYPENGTPDMSRFTESEASKNCIYHCQKQNYSIRFSYHEKILSAHGSGIKGVWTDGRWVFSTGLDQRVRCWHIEESGKVTEHAHLIISVPEPEALDARACGRNHYQIAVTGRGMQMVEFVAPGGVNDEDS